MDKKLEKRYASYTDEKLKEILEIGMPGYTEDALRVAQEILISRGLGEVELSELDSDYKKIDPTLESGDDLQLFQTDGKTSTINYTPILVGIVLLAMNYYLAGAIYEYNVTGKGSAAIDYMRSIGVVHDVFFRAIIVGFIIYYVQKQKGKYLWLWILLGILFGAWALIGVGVLELLTDYEGKDKEDIVPEA